MALSDGPITVEENEALNERARAREKATAQAQALDTSRQSAPALLELDGVFYTYVLIDGEVVRIQRVRVERADDGESAGESVDGEGAENGVLHVPARIDDKPVVALSADAFSRQACITELYLPDSIVSIGGGAFRNCTGLRRVKLPALLNDFNSGWFTFCENIEEIWLSGAWENIRASVFDLPKLKKLHIGAGTRRVEPGAFQKSQLEIVTVDPGNPYLATDGRAIYSRAKNDAQAVMKANICSDIELQKPQKSKNAQDEDIDTNICSSAELRSLQNSHYPQDLQNSQDITKCADISIEASAHAHAPQTGDKMWVLAVPGAEYEVRAGTKSIARKAFSAFSQLERVVLPDSVENIGEFALTRTNVRDFTAPTSLKHIREKAFFRCSQLENVTLNEGLETVGEEAFASTALERIEFPRSIQVIERRATADTRVTYSTAFPLPATSPALGMKQSTSSNPAPGASPVAGASSAPGASPVAGVSSAASASLAPGASPASSASPAPNANNKPPAPTFVIPPDAEYLRLDDQGVLYSTQTGEKVLVQVVEPNVTQIKVQPGTTRIAAQATRNHKNLAAIKIPDGVRVIEREAFKGCRELYWVELPDSVERIEDEAFLDTVLQHINLPANLAYLGTKALITYGAHHTGTLNPTLKEVIIPASLQERYFTVPGLLCQRREDGTVRVMVCLGAEEIHLPPDTTTIDEYAFGNARGIRRLYFSDKIHSIGMCGFALACWLEHIHVDLTKPVQGHDHFDFYFPFNDRAVQQIKLTFSMMRSVDIGRIFAAYDQVICNGAGLQGGQGDSGMTLYDQAQRVISRLSDPIYMSKVHRNMFLSFLKHSIEDICVEVARKDDRRTFDALLDFGYLNDENLLRVIERVSNIQDAAMTGYLLEVRRRLFNKDIIDFEL